MRKIYTFLIAAMFSTLGLAYSDGQWGPPWDEGSANGYEPGRTLFVCRAYAHGGVHPGKVVAGNCNIGYGGHEEVYGPEHYDVYTGTGQWHHKDSGFWWGGAVRGGYENDGRDLLVCLAPAHGGWHPGKVVAGYCNIGYGGLEESYSNYSILVE